MQITKEYKRDVNKAIRASKSGKAYHWPTIAAILADEVGRLQAILDEVTKEKGE